MTERVSPRTFRLVAYQRPPIARSRKSMRSVTSRTFRQPAKSCIFDRSWYNRAGVEHVMGFCTKEQHKRFLEMCPPFGKNIIIDNGIRLVKYWLEVSNKEQKRRFRRASTIACGSGS